MLIVLDSIGNNMFKNFCIYLHMSQWMSVDTLPPRHQSKSFANSPTTIWNYPEHPPICLSTLKLKLNIMSFHDPPWTLEKSWTSCLETSFCISIFTKKDWKSSIKLGSNVPSPNPGPRRSSLRLAASSSAKRSCCSRANKWDHAIDCEGNVTWTCPVDSHPSLSVFLWLIFWFCLLFSLGAISVSLFSCNIDMGALPWICTYFWSWNVGDRLVYFSQNSSRGLAR